MLTAPGRKPAIEAEIWFDVSPLLERDWTGIPVVAAGLARALLRTLPAQACFFLDSDVIESAAVAEALGRQTGLFLAREIETGRARRGKLPLLRRDRPTIGLFPSVKRVRRVFDAECSIVHDLSTLVTPRFHVSENIAHHMEAILADIATNDVTIAVSHATKADLVAYLGVAEDRVVVAANGVEWPDAFAIAASNESLDSIEPYFLVLGTREPRKNILLVFEMLEAYPELLRTHRFVFAGRMGWLEEQHLLPPRLAPAVEQGRIRLPGFVSELRKYLLLAGAEALLFPSYLEGFGLPVLESLSAGTPCVASWSSSIPEIGGDLCRYFDPFSAADFKRAIDDVLRQRQSMGTALSVACQHRAAEFTWTAMLARILQAVAARAAVHA